MPSSSRRRVLLTLAGAVSAGGTVTGRPATTDHQQRAVTARRDDHGPPAQWEHVFGGSGNDAVVDAVPSHDGGVALLVAAGGENRSVRVVAFAPDGTRDWTRQYDAPGRDGAAGDGVPHALVRTATGYVVGGYGDLGRYSQNPWLLAIAPDGTPRWQRRYDDLSGEFQTEAQARRPDGGFVLGGHVDVGDEESTFTLGTDAEGRRQWFRRYDGEFAWLTDVAAVDDGYVLVGHSHSRFAGDPSAITATVLGTDESGRERWRRTFGGTTGARLQTVVATPYGALAGGHNSAPSPGGLLTAVDARGRPIWRRRLPEQPVVDVVPLADGYVVAGESEVTGVDSWGRRRWGGDPNEAGLRAAAVAGGTLYVGGRTNYRNQDVGAQAWVTAFALP